MIYATAGTHPAAFNRLIQAIEAYAAQTDEEVIVQAGTSQIPIYYAKHLTFTTWEEALTYIRTARVVVSHAGVGTMIDAISVNVPIIVWPRLADFGEHINNHQLELAQAMSQQGRATLVNNRDELFAALNRDVLPLPTGAGQGSK